MSNVKYKMMKVFDCYNMPRDVKDKFFDDSTKGNDCYVSEYCYNEWKPVSEVKNEKNVILREFSDGEEYAIERGDDIISDWLYDNGAEIWEKVLIKHAW